MPRENRNQRDAYEESGHMPQLAFHRVDPERRVGLPAGRYTQPIQLTVMVLAGIITVAVYGGLALIPDHYITQSLTQRGWVPRAIVVLTTWSLLILGCKTLKLRAQRRALRIRIIPDDPTFTLSLLNVESVLEDMFERIDRPRDFVLFNRVQLALSNLRNMRRISDVGEVLESQANTDEAIFESSYTVVRGLVWAIPVLGFIGTVLGLSAAIGEFGQVLSAANDIATIKPALQQVTGGLSVAFETTLQGLLGALGVQLVLTFVRRAEEGFLDDCKEYCQRNIVNRLRILEDSGD
jgi:biopolymer transport protein ExbB/TolQ